MLRGLTWGECEELLNSWEKSIRDNNVYGYGLSKMMNFQAPACRWLDDGFSFKGLVDKNTALHGLTIMGFPIISIDELPIHEDTKVVVVANDYPAISERLKAMGLQEKKNFIFINDYWTLWGFYRHRKIIYSHLISILLTDRCTLKCEFCGAKIPYLRVYEGDRDISKIEADLDLFFSRADWLTDLGFGGGEPLLYNDMPALLTLIGRKYRTKMYSCHITTNGTITPDEKVLQLAADHNIRFNISYYSGCGIGDGYEAKFERLKRTFDAYGIDYTVTSYPWIDFSLSQDESNELAALDSEEMSRRFRACNSGCSSLLDGFYYSCAVSCHEKKLGVISANDYTDGVDFNAIDPGNAADRKKLMATSLGYHSKPILKACETCSLMTGRKKFAPRGRQLKG